MNRSTSIDSLRGIAALCIVLLHARQMLWIGVTATWTKYGFGFDPNALLGYLTAPILFGNLGVYLFFVLSGYCIHSRGAADLAHNETKPLDVKAFALRRLIRIYPVYFAVLSFTLLVDSLVMASGLIQLEKDQDHSWTTFLASIFSLQGLVAPTFGSNGVFWTLSIEMHLYAAYPGLYYLSRRYGPEMTLFFTLLVSLAYVFLDNLLGIRLMLYSSSGIGPIFLSYLFMWTVGFYVAEVSAGRAHLPEWTYRMSLMSATILVILILSERLVGKHVIGIFLYDAATAILSGIAFGGLVRWSTTRGGIAFFDRAFGRHLARVGVFSYSLYAIHVPALLVFKSAIVALDVSTETLGPAALGVLVAMLAGLACFFTIEQWSLKTRNMLR